MTKLISWLLSVALIVSSVMPSLAQVPAGRQFVRGAGRALRVPAVAPKPVPLPVSDAALLRHARLPLTLQHAHLLPSTTIPVSQQILNHTQPAQRALLLRSDFTALALNRQATPHQIGQAVDFYREQLATPETLFSQITQASLTPGTQQAAALAGTVADVSALGLFGTAEKDAPLILNVYKQAVGTAAEPVITAVAARALLRLQAYGPLQEMATISTQQPELWQGIATYAAANRLPVVIAQQPRTEVDVSSFQTALADLGPLNTIVVSPSQTGTFLYMGAGKNEAPVASQTDPATAPVQETPVSVQEPVSPQAQAAPAKETLPLVPAVELPEGVTPENLNTPAPYASQGAPVAHVGPVQPVMPQTTAQKMLPQEEPVSAPSTTPVSTEPAYVRQTVTNALGQEVEGWVPNPNLQAAQTGTNSTGRSLSWLDKARLQWALHVKPTFSTLGSMGSSRYGWLALGTGVAPLTSEQAVALADNPAVVQQIRLQQQSFISPQELYGGSGASYHMSGVNTGALAAQEYARLQTPLAASTTSPSSNSGILMSTLVPLPGFVTRWFESETVAANRQARIVLNQAAPLPTQLVALLKTPASAELKQQALVRLYRMGKLTSILKRTLPAPARQAVEELGRSENMDALGKRLYSLYEERLISSALDKITDTAAQGELLEELAQIVSTPGFANQSRALWEATNQIPVMSAEDIGTTSFVPEADLELVYSAFRTEEDFVAKNVQAQDRGSFLHYEDHIPFYYRDEHGKLSEDPVGILTQNHPGAYGRFLSHIPMGLQFPSWKYPSTWFDSNSWKVKYMADRPGLDIPKGFVLALDENGQWKFVKQDRAKAESYPASQQLLKELESKGSLPVGLETPYSTADLLAVAKMLEKKTQAQRAGKLTTPLSFELGLNSADSFKQMLKIWGFYIGLDTGAALSGPFKDALKSLNGSPINAVSNIVGGLGYASPIVAAFTSRWMRQWGLKASMFGLFGAAGLGLGYSLFGLGMTGWDDPKLLGLGAQTIPFITAIFTGSLFGVLQPLVLNHYKNPVARTAANLEFSSTKQKARMLLTLATFAFGLEALGGLKWTLAIPAAFGLLGTSFMLFLNTPLVRSATPASGVATSDPVVRNLLASVKKPEKAELTAAQRKAEAQEFAADYRRTFSNSAAVRGIRDRVSNVYAGYAPLMALVSQIVNAPGTIPLFSKYNINVAQLAMVGFMFCAYRMRQWATSQVKSNRYTDDQLTGLSLPILAATSLLIAGLPFDSVYALATAAVVAALYVGTAVPGQLDNTRMQNIVSEEMQSRKQAVSENPQLSKEEKAAQLAKLERQEKDWGFRATRDYSYYNGVGLVGVGAATLISYLLADQHIGEELLRAIQPYAENPVFTMDRLIFILSGLVLGGLSYRHWNLTQDFWRARNPVLITQENIQAGNINAQSFGISQSNVDANLGKQRKELKELQKLSLEHGLSSEQKMTSTLNKMVAIYNRLVAIREIKGMSENVQQNFNTLLGLAQNYRQALAYNNLSVMLNREFDKFAQALSKEGKLTELAEEMPYLEEGKYTLPVQHAQFEEARDLIQKDLFQLAHRILNGEGVDARTYRLFIEYQNRAKVDLQQYTQANVADSKRALDLMRELNGICLTLKRADAMSGILDTNAGPTSQQDIQALRDMLAGFPDEGETFR